MKKINVITIDGPSASGKGALARGIANKFDFNILDSGVLYRLYAYLSKMSFSPDEIANQIKDRFGLADFVTANNVYAHINNMDEVTDAIKTVLSNKGIFSFEVSYLPDVIKKLF